MKHQQTPLTAPRPVDGLVMRHARETGGFNEAVEIAGRIEREAGTLALMYEIPALCEVLGAPTPTGGAVLLNGFAGALATEIFRRDYPPMSLAGAMARDVEEDAEMRAEHEYDVLKARLENFGPRPWPWEDDSIHGEYDEAALAAAAEAAPLPGDLVQNLDDEEPAADAEAWMLQEIRCDQFEDELDAYERALEHTPFLAEDLEQDTAAWQQILEDCDLAHCERVA